MPRYIPVILMGILALFLVIGCSSEKKADTQMEMKSEVEKTLDVTPDMLTTHIDLTCGMDLNKHAITDTTVYQGQLYGFCSDHCKQKFLEDPEAAIAKMEVTP